ncbi:MAG: hypothetical protein AAF198_03155 [Pseudomonadota bacterium]
MCMTTVALATFLNLISSDIVTVSSEKVTIAAKDNTAIWIATGDALWCIEKPAIVVKAEG